MADFAKRTKTSGAVTLPVYKQITPQPTGFDLFRLPGLRRFVRWKYARAVFQIPLLVLALFVIVDGLTGRQLAPRNVATTTVWLHYRGLVVLALALVGNAFCAACPLMLTRGLTRRLEDLLPHKLVWPKALKNKFFVLALTFFYLFSYEYFDLWASPWLTAWLAVGYFGAALAVDTLFKAGTFCRYVCPLGNFNFVFSSASPTQITAVDHDVCRECEHKPCLQGRYSGEVKPEHLPLQTNGSKQVAFIPVSDITHANGAGFFPGCETELFVPTVQSNVDCTNCFNCVRACPYDNVSLTVRRPGWEWTRAPWERRGRLALTLFGVLLTFWGLLNAVGMIGPYFRIAQGLATALNTENEGVVLGVLFVAASLFGIGVTLALASLADALGRGESRALARAATLGLRRRRARLRVLGLALFVSLPDGLAYHRAGVRTLFRVPGLRRRPELAAGAARAVQLAVSGDGGDNPAVRGVRAFRYLQNRPARFFAARGCWRCGP